MPDLEKQIAALEALLFIHGEPVTYKKIGSPWDEERRSRDARRRT